jgi:hypothetical protein
VSWLGIDCECGRVYGPTQRAGEAAMSCSTRGGLRVQVPLLVQARRRCSRHVAGRHVAARHSSAVPFVSEVGVVRGPLGTTSQLRINASEAGGYLRCVMGQGRTGNDRDRGAVRVRAARWPCRWHWHDLDVAPSTRAWSSFRTPCHLSGGVAEGAP